MKATWTGPLLALASAGLFGASTPLAKLLLGVTDPVLLAGLLYLGSGIGLGIMRLCIRFRPTGEAPLRPPDLPWVALVVLFGGVLGPALLMAGLISASGAAGSLLLTVESLATITIAWIVLRENVDRRLFLGAMSILAGAIVLSWPPNNVVDLSFGWGSALIVAACLCWGIDNNLTRKISAADPVQIAMIKGFAAGLVNTAIGVACGAKLPEPGAIAAVALIGFLGYGVSLVFFVLGLRHLGAARTGAYFSIAPFIGAALALPLLGESVTWPLTVAAALMGIGVLLHLVEDHEHVHVHEPLFHEHRHLHDAHHQHVHTPGNPEGEPHSHQHQHSYLEHKHPHYPDLHHRHSHAE